MRTNLRPAAAAALVVAVAGVLAACGSSGTASPTTTDAGAGVISVVASTNVWGDVVEQIGRDHVDVLSIVSDPSADPHSFEANAQTQLALSKAALIVENGGGYDDFVDTMLASAQSSAPVINAVEVSGKDTAGAELNEHVWYDLPTVDKVAQKIATELGTLDPGNQADFTANAKKFSADVANLFAQVQQVQAAHAGTGIAITEPVPLYLLEAAGLVNLTPEEFSNAIEDDTDVSPTVLQETLALFSDRKVKALFYNEQTTGPQTEAVLDAAKSNTIAVVPVRETLPDGQDYLQWMQANVTALGAAVGS